MINSMEDNYRGFSRMVNQKRQTSLWGPSALIIRNLINFNSSFEGNWPLLFLLAWQLLIYSIDITWIISKESVDGSLDNTCTSIRGNPGERVFSPPFWFKSYSDAFV